MKAKNVVVWGMFGLFGYLAAKEAMAGAGGDGRRGRRRNVGGGGRLPQPLGKGSLGKAEAYTDAFPEEGLGGLDPGR